MKRTLVCLVIISLILSAACAEGNRITFHDAFGLSYGATDEQIFTAVTSVFNAKQSESDKSFYSVSNAFLYDIPIRWISGSAFTSTFNNKFVSLVTVTLDDESLNAWNVCILYRKFCELYGEPTYYDVTTEAITMSGKEKTGIQIDESERLQQAIDRANLRGLVCWDNISLVFDSFVSDATGTDKNYISFEVEAAFSEAALQYPIISLYGLKDK